MDIQFDVIIIGSGPGGMTAGLYASRGGLSVALLEAEAPGGKMVKTDLICNYPGMDNINGADLAIKMFDHATHYGAQYMYGNVTAIKDKGDYKEVYCEDGNVYTARVVIAATGTKEKTLGLAGEETLTGRGLSYCAVCDGAFFKDKIVTVIGGGNSALEESTYLTQFASQVNLIIRRDVFRGDDKAVQDVLKNKKINVIRKHVPKEFVLTDKKISGLVIENVDTHELTTIETQGLFPYIGANPVTAYLNDLGVLNEEGYIIVDKNCETKIKGLYGIGDALDKTLRQIVTATADGAIAAQHCVPYIQSFRE